MSTVELGGEEIDYLILEQQICFALAVASRSVIALYRPVLEPLGLTHPQYLVMVALWQSKSLSVKEISALLQVESPSVSPVLKRLQAAGLVERHRDVTDERSVRITLTPRGVALREEAGHIPMAMVERLGMSIPELEALHATLTHVIERAHHYAPETPEGTSVAERTSVAEGTSDADVG